jgi:uncharacterized Zn finger protein (UPF0148 family)
MRICATSYAIVYQKRGAMADQSISCPSCGKKIPLTRALRAEIESAARERYEQTPSERERELRSAFDR